MFIDSDSAETDAAAQDMLTCGTCQKVFALADIVKFVQHKVLHCNKENYGQCSNQGMNDNRKNSTKPQHNFLWYVAICCWILGPSNDRTEADDGRPLSLANRRPSTTSTSNVTRKTSSSSSSSSVTAISAVAAAAAAAAAVGAASAISTSGSTRVHTPPPSPADMLADGASSTPKRLLTGKGDFLRSLDQYQYQPWILKYLSEIIPWTFRRRQRIIKVGLSSTKGDDWPTEKSNKRRCCAQNNGASIRANKFVHPNFTGRDKTGARGHRNE